MLSACSCITSLPSKRILEPRESSEIIVSYKGKTVPLEKKESLEVLVVSNDPDNPYIKLLMTCKVHSKVFWFPNAISFHSKYGEGGIREVQLISDRTENFTVQEINTSSGDISVSYKKNATGILCNVKLSPHSPKGNRTEKLILNVQADAFNREIEIPVYIMISSDS